MHPHLLWNSFLPNEQLSAQPFLQILSYLPFPETFMHFMALQSSGIWLYESHPPQSHSSPEIVPPSPALETTALHIQGHSEQQLLGGYAFIVPLQHYACTHCITVVKGNQPSKLSDTADTETLCQKMCQRFSKF